MCSVSDRYLKKDFWTEENLLYAQPYFRLEKCATLINSINCTMKSDLLDVGCGPATLAKLLDKNINYYGIDIAIHEATPNLIETDFIESEIKFRDKTFDFVVAAGVFEYVGRYQRTKFSEIRKILNKNGKFIVTFTNFDHLHKIINYFPYNNIQSIKGFKKDLELYFHVDRWFPSSHNWMCTEPRRKFLKKIQMHLNVYLPIISPLLAVNYFFICSVR